MPVKKTAKKLIKKVNKRVHKKSGVDAGVPNYKLVEWILRLGVSGTFLGHGVFALQIKSGWIPYFTGVGISEGAAMSLLPMIGLLDVMVAIFALLYPLRIVFGWAVIWGLTTALIRPITGSPIWDFVERTSNFMVPLALLYLLGMPRTLRGWLRV